MRWKSSWLTAWFVVVAQGMLIAAAVAADVDTYARRIATLVDPAKLATLADRAANPRVQKYVAHLAEARQAGVSTVAVVNRALILVGMKGEASKLTADAMLRNLTIAERLGCLIPQGIDLMRRGNSPIVLRGPYTGDKLSVD